MPNFGIGATNEGGSLEGADPEQLSALKEQLQKQIDSIDQAQKAQREKDTK